ncbi:P-type ATPase [Pelagophyceae sp. CCMP2097]|nr:P-type ATPase [Pelagophyceae sp. CCMP2097]
MRAFRSCVPEFALVLRDGEWEDVDASALVVGDLVRLRHGDGAAADLRVAEASFDFGLSDCAVTGSRIALKPKKGDLVALGSTCTSGEAKLVVVAIGNKTLLATKLREGTWPPRR